MSIRVLVAALAALSTCAAGAATAADPDPPAPIEQAQSKPGQVVVGGRVVKYVATPGTLLIRDDAGEALGSMFYTAYVANRAPGAPERPIVFAYNGGPGSSTMWLHMGSVGPAYVDAGTPTAPARPPFAVRPNPNTVLEHADIVFLDAIGTGLSRPVGKGKGADFWGVDKDIDAFARGVTRYLALNDRWNSPKFLFGESYGAMRSAGLVYKLQESGVQVNGVILLSSILNFGVRQLGYDQVNVNNLPSFAATAWYHNRLADRPATLEPWLSEVRAWARGPYLAALQQGYDLPEAERLAIATTLSRYTGLSTDFLLKANLRVTLPRFRKELLRDQRRTIGHLDGRFLGQDADPLGDAPDFDAADSFVSGAYVAAQNDYLFKTLGYKTALSYRPNYAATISAEWDQKHRASGFRGSGAVMAMADTALDLGVAMRHNPGLKVLSLNGYYDLATPFFATEYDLKHMPIDPVLKDNITFKYYPSGHMVYLDPASHRQMAHDIAAFIDAASPP